MALTDVINFGKKALKLEELRNNFVQDSSLNAMLEVAKIQDLERIDSLAYQALAISSLDAAPARHRQTLESYMGVNQGEAIGAVQANVREAIDGIRKDETLKDYVVQSKPIEYKGNGFDDAIYNAHKAASKAGVLLNNQEAMSKEVNDVMEKSIKNLEDKKVNSAIIEAVKWAYSVNGNVVVNKIRVGAIKAIEEFKKIEVAKLRDYAFGRYGALNDDDKKKDAYAIARAVAQSN